ncbi:MAG: GerMN domain-containing protein [Actinobacteria bacterium]|nr:GerMN domain-containing protein [Actinomycetota bacterium]
MKPDNELLKKKKKRPSRFIRLIFTMIFIIAIVSLIFYSVDNPDFIPSIKNKIIAFYTSDESIAADSSALESGQIGGESTSTSAESSSESVNSAAPGDTVIENPADNKFLLLWQRIINFFIKRASQDKDKFPDKLNIKIYFAGIGQQQEFVFEERTIFAGDPKIAVTNAVKELINGPSKSYHFPVIPPGTKLLGVDVYENFAKINFSQDFLQNSLESGILDEYVIYTIVNTVTEIPEIEGVIFLIEGIRIKLYGQVDLSIPAIRNEKYLNSENDN